MKSSRSAAAYLCAASIALTACGRSEPAAPAPAPTTAPSATPTSAPVAPAVPDLGDPSRWKKTADGKVIVTPDNFIRAESDVYMAGQFKDGAFGKFKHSREVASVDRQLIVRLNRDTIYSSGLFDLDAGPVTITLPDAGDRFLSALVINEDHYNPQVFYGAGTHTLTRQDVGTRYGMVAVRIFVDPNNPKGGDGAITVQFGDCSRETPNCLPVTRGWNYLVRLYRPRQEILNGTWSLPAAEPIQ